MVRQKIGASGQRLEIELYLTEAVSLNGILSPDNYFSMHSPGL